MTTLRNLTFRLALTTAALFVTVAMAQYSASAGERIRIVQMNAENLTPPGQRARLERYRWDEARTAHFERIAAVIEAIDPDILNLCEATSKESVDLLVKILHEKGMTEYAGYHIDNSDTFTGFDVALLTKLKPDLIDERPIRHITSAAGDGTYREKYVYKDETGTVRQKDSSISRNALYYFTIGGHKLGFFGLHLKAQPDDPASNGQRTAEATVAQRIIRKEIIDRGYLPIVIGDLNDYDPDVPDRDESRNTMTKVLTMLKDFDDSRPGLEMANAAERMPRQADRYTNHWDRNENRASDPGDVYSMIDHVLLPRQLMPGIRRAFIYHSLPADTTDHWPVVVDLELPAAGAASVSKK